MLSGFFLSVFIPNVIMLSVTMMSVTMLSVTMLIVIMLRVVMLRVVMLSVIMLSVIMLRVVILSVVMLSGVILSVVMLSVSMLSSYSGCRSAFTDPVQKDGVVLVSTNVQGVALELEVDGRVVIADVRHVLYSGNLLRRDVSVFHRHQWYVDANL